MSSAIPTSCITPHSRTYKVQPSVAISNSSAPRIALDAWHANCFLFMAASGGLSFQPSSYQSM